MSTQTEAPQVVHVHHHHAEVRNPTLAVLLELLPGFFAQTFGIGNIYAGNVGLGLLYLFGYWASCVVNFVLCAFLIGFITWPLTWLGFAIVASMTASSGAHRANEVG